MAGALMAFNCPTHACTLLIGLVLTLREKQDKEERRTLTCLGGSYWGTVGSGTFVTHQGSRVEGDCPLLAPLDVSQPPQCAGLDFFNRFPPPWFAGILA